MIIILNTHGEKKELLQEEDIEKIKIISFIPLEVEIITQKCKLCVCQMRNTDMCDIFREEETLIRHVGYVLLSDIIELTATIRLTAGEKYEV